MYIFRIKVQYQEFTGSTKSTVGDKEFVYTIKLERPLVSISQFDNIVREIGDQISRFQEILIDPLILLRSSLYGKSVWIVFNDNGTIQAVMSSEKNANLVQEACPGSKVVPREIDQPNCAPPPNVIVNIFKAIDNKLDEIADREK